MSIPTNVGQGTEMVARVDRSLNTPSVARIYDWYLGGANNLDVDRKFGEQVEKILPTIKPLARNNRAFLRRVVKEALQKGITQFLDIGSGIPTVGNVHEVAFEANPLARVVYVDYEPIAFEHATLLLQEQNVTNQATIIQEDLRHPEKILNHPDTTRLIDFTQPVCMLMVALLHFIGPEAHPTELISRFRQQLAPGSWFAMSHLASDQAPAEQADQVEQFAEAYRKKATEPLYVRSHAEVTELFTGWELLEPGVVFLPDWRPEDPNREGTLADQLAWCGVGQKSAT